MKKIAVFASGRGSNFEHFCIAQSKGKLAKPIGLLIANKPEIGAIETADKYGIAHAVFKSKNYDDAESYNQELLECLVKHQIEYIALAGWLQLIHSSIIKNYPNRIINIHPALLPLFGGKGMYGKHVHLAVWESGMRISGATVHFVNNAYDRGQIILQESTQLTDKDTPESIAEKVLKVEHRIFPKALKLLTENRIILKENRVYII